MLWRVNTGHEVDTLIPPNRLERAGEAVRERAPPPCLISKPHGRGGFQRGAGLKVAARSDL
jgi:hypothetical protein